MWRNLKFLHIGQLCNSFVAINAVLLHFVLKSVLSQMTFFCVEKIEPKIVPVEKIDPKIVPVEKIEPTIVSVEKIEPKIVSVEKIEPKLVSVEKIEPTIVSVEKIEPTIVSVEKIEPTIVSVEKMTNMRCASPTRVSLSLSINRDEIILFTTND